MNHHFTDKNCETPANLPDTDPIFHMNQPGEAYYNKNKKGECTTEMRKLQHWHTFVTGRRDLNINVEEDGKKFSKTLKHVNNSGQFIW